MRIPLNRLYDVLSFDTSSFYTDDEAAIEARLQKARRILGNIEKKHSSGKYSDSGYKRHKKWINGILRDLKDSLKREIDRFNSTGMTRTVRQNAKNTHNVVSVFDSTLTRAFGMREDALNPSMVIVRVYFFGVFESIVKHGFYMDGKRYIFFSASAGQIRMKRGVFVLESLYREVEDKLTCGLTIDKINAAGGCNVNKYLVYLALCNSATDVWQDFNIDECIVVDDLEVLVHGLVDYIDPATYQIERKEMDIPIKMTDGCGMMLPAVSTKSFMVRAPWLKGLLTPFRFDDFIEEANARNPAVNHGRIKDVWGKTWDVRRDRIRIIFTKSQLKMWQYFGSWQEYKDAFKAFHCEAGICNREENYIRNATINYQMLQTLPDMTDKELMKLTEDTREKITSIAQSKETMLSAFGATVDNENKNPFQEALLLYPELLRDPYTKDTLSQIKRSMEIDAWAGKLHIRAKYTFIIPDMYAFCEFLFLGDKTPAGLLGDGEVYCRLYRNTKKLDCLRSPHLYMEHAIRENMCVQNSPMARWFITDGLYTSTHDLISKLLMFDNDGDKSLVAAERTLINVAERNCRSIVPIYYEMASAKVVQITKDEMYNGMIRAFTGGNIGRVSNNITKIWNSKTFIDGSVEEREKALNAVKWLCMENNFVIDYAKTLYKPTRPDDVNEIISSYTRVKLPAFFTYAKDFDKDDLLLPNNSTVNRIRQMIPRKRIRYDYTGIGELDYKVLMHDPTIAVTEWDRVILDKWNSLCRNVNLFRYVDSSDGDNYAHLFASIRSEMMSLCNDSQYVVDVLVRDLFLNRPDSKKVVLWNVFGEEIVENIRQNTRHMQICTVCGTRFYDPETTDGLCGSCRRHKTA